MLNRIAQMPLSPSCAPQPMHSEDKWQRNEIEDMKKGIEFLYEFKEKLSKLHPIVSDAIETMLQRPRY
jgi:hypothetical protein